MSVPGIIIASILFLAGLAGTVLPLLPGVILVFAGTLVYGFMVDFQGGFNTVFYAGQAAAVLLVFLLDYAAGVWGAKKYGGSRAAVIGSLLGAVLGVITMGPFGVILGPFIGAAAGDVLVRGDLSGALRAGIGTIVGFLGGTAAKLFIEIAMIIWFFTAAL